MGRWALGLLAALSALGLTASGCRKGPSPRWRCDPEACQGAAAVLEVQPTPDPEAHFAALAAVFRRAGAQGCAVRVLPHPAYPRLTQCPCLRPVRKWWRLLTPTAPPAGACDGPPPAEELPALVGSHEVGDAFNVLLGIDKAHAVGRACPDLKDQLLVHLPLASLAGAFHNGLWVPAANVSLPYSPPPLAYFLYLAGLRRWRRVQFLCPTLGEPICPILAQLPSFGFTRLEVRFEVGLEAAIHLMACAESVASPASPLAHAWHAAPRAAREFSFLAAAGLPPCPPCDPRERLYFRTLPDEPHNGSLALRWRNTARERERLFAPVNFTVDSCPARTRQPAPAPLQPNATSDFTRCRGGRVRCPVVPLRS